MTTEGAKYTYRPPLDQGHYSQISVGESLIAVATRVGNGPAWDGRYMTEDGWKNITEQPTAEDAARVLIAGYEKHEPIMAAIRRDYEQSFTQPPRLLPRNSK